MDVNLHYGTGMVSLQIPEVNIEQIIRPWQDETKEDNITLVRRATEAKEADSFVRAITGKRLCVLLDDGTRDEPLGDILGQLFALLRDSTLVRFLICTGTHDAETAENKRICEQVEKSADKAAMRNFEVHVHDCQQDRHSRAGRTSRGTEIIFNSRADDVDVFLVVSDAKAHYFAGYSNPIKNFVPGICAFETAEQNHSLALDSQATFGVHPWHPDENKRGNHLAEDQLEGMRLIVGDRPVYALVTISASGRIQWAGLGPAEKVSGEAFALIDDRNSHTTRQVGHLIVSPGGLPNDISLYIAHRALELTKNAVADDGEILFLSACPSGIGEKKTVENFYNRLTAPLDDILRSIEREYKLYAHKPYKFAQLLKRLRGIWIHTEIPDNLIQAAHLQPAHRPQKVVDDWLAKDPDTKILVVDGANKVALYSKR